MSPARSVSIFEDLGIQQAPHSTLSSYLEKLIWALTGNFAIISIHAPVFYAFGITCWSSPIGCGVRMPATTSSPWAFCR